MDFEFLGGLIVIVAIPLGIFLNFDSNYWTNEVTVYQIFHDSKNGLDSTFKPITYKTLNERQQVIYWIDGFPPYSYENCAVRNYENWVCKIKSAFGDYEVQMLNGKYTDGKALLNGAEIVPKWKYWLVRVQEDNFYKWN